jgi:hypothetical protein
MDGNQAETDEGMNWAMQVSGTSDDSVDHGEAMDSLWVELEDRINHSTYNGKTFFDYYRSYKRTPSQVAKDTMHERDGLKNPRIFNENDFLSFAKKLVTDVAVNKRTFQDLAKELQIPESILESMYRDFMKILRGRIDKGSKLPSRRVDNTRRDIITRLEQAVDRYPAPQTGISRYIEDYPDNELAEVGFTRLSNLLQPLATDAFFNWDNFNKVFNQACDLIESMIEKLGVIDGDDDSFRKFESDITMCGYYATKALDIVLFRLARKRTPKNPEAELLTVTDTAGQPSDFNRDGFARYIHGYSNNEIAIGKFGQLDDSLKSLYGSDFHKKKDFNKILDRASKLIENMMLAFCILNRDELVFEKFKRDINMFGYYATRALSLALFRLAKRENPNQN